MYNEERKQQYLTEKRSRSILAYNLQSAMELAGNREEELQRDLSEWTVSEIVSFFKYYSSASIQSLVMLKNSLEGYTDWCISNGLVKDNQNHYRDVTTDLLCDCINLNLLKETIMFRKEFLSMIKDLPNFRDQFVFLGLYEGLSDKYIDQVKMSDLVRDIVTLPDGSRRTISKELVHIMEMADTEEYCISMGASYSAEFGYGDPALITSTKRAEFAGSTPWEEGDTIVRDAVPRLKHRASIRKGVALLGIRIRACNKFLGKNWTIKGIQESGRLQMIVELSKQFNTSIDKIITDPDFRQIHEARFGKLQQVKTYMLTYGRLLQNEKEIHKSLEI